MRRKLLLVCSGALFLLFLVVSWFGWHAVNRQLLLVEMKNHYDIGQQAVRKHQNRKAMYCFGLAIQAWEQAERSPGFLPVENGGFDGFLTAGNSYRMARRLWRARQCYERGLRYDPNSITLLTALGGCAYAMGDLRAAYENLKKSNQKYPLKKRWRPILKKLENSIGSRSADRK